MSVNSKMTAIADQIRTLQGGTDKLGLDAMAAEIDVANRTVESQAELLAALNQALSGKGVPSDATLQEKTVTPSASPQDICADAGNYALSKVVVEGDEDLIPANIKRGVEIFGVKGSYSGSGGSVSTKTTAPLEVNGTDYSVDGMPQMGFYKRDYELNTTIHLAYTGSKTFLHWLDTRGKILSAGAVEAEFTHMAEARAYPVTLDESIAAQTPPCAYIEFMSDYSQVMGADVWSSTDSPDQHVLPQTPMKTGAKALGWTLDGQTVCTAQDIINSIDGSAAYKEIRCLYENVVVPLTITVGNNIDDTTFTAAATRGKVKAISKPKTGYENYIIKCWSWDKEGTQPIGYNGTNYGMVPTHDTTCYIQYVPTGTPVERLSAVTLSGAYAAGDENDFAVVVISIYDIMSNHSLVSTGMRYAFGNDVDADNAEASLLIGTGIGTTAVSRSTSKRASFTVITRPPATDEVVWVRSYLVYADQNGVQHTVYSPVMSWTYDELIAKDKEAGIIE